MNNTRFATAVHILTLLASEPEVWMSSEWIAKSININPVMVRRELAVLKEAGLVISKKGKEGGVTLGKSAKDIRFSDVLQAVNHSELLGRKNKNNNPDCRIGKQINEQLNLLFHQIDETVLKKLENKSLEDFLKQFR